MRSQCCGYGCGQSFCSFLFWELRERQEYTYDACRTCTTKWMRLIYGFIKSTIRYTVLKKIRARDNVSQGKVPTCCVGTFSLNTFCEPTRNDINERKQ